MGAENSAITGANSATTGTSQARLYEIGTILVAAAMLIPREMELRDFGYWSREVLTGFPELRSRIKRGWLEHKFEWSKEGTE